MNQTGNTFSCIQCKRLWQVEQIGVEFWTVESYEFKVQYSPVTTIENLIAAVFSGELQPDYQPTVYCESWNVAGMTPCCPSCGGDLERIYELKLE